MWFQLYYLSEWVIRLSMVGVVPRYRRPVSTMGWLLIIFFLPWVGLILYLLIGANRPAAHRLRQHEKLQQYLVGVGGRFSSYRETFKVKLDKQSAEVAALVERLGAMPVFGGNQVELISDSVAFIDRLIRDIDAARDHVHLLFYIYTDDAFGHQVTDALVRAVKRGVVCRLLVDAVASRKLLKRRKAQLLAAGIELQDALPVMSLRRFIGRVDWRNHRKIVVIDGHTGYTGSQNIVEPSYGHSNLVWHDIMACIKGPAVLELQAVFVGDWYMETGKLLDSDQIFSEATVAGDVPVQILPSGPIYSTENYQRLIVAALYDARQQVVITTPYFVPDDAFLQAVETARLREVDVQLVVPETIDQILPGYAAKAYFDILLNLGVKIYLYTEGLLHAKTMSVDNRLSYFGSSNFDIRSFVLDFEVNLVFYGEAETGLLCTQQQNYIQHSVLLTAEVWQKRSKVGRAFENVAKLFSPLL